MIQYLDYLRNIRENGDVKTDRTGTGTVSLFGLQMRFNLADGFPIVTTKKTHLKSIIHELLWFLKGETNIRYLKEHGVSIWDEWADENGDLGPVYGDQWINWEDIRVISGDSASLDLWINQRGYEVLHFSDNLKDTTIGRLVVRKRFNQIQQVIDQLKNSPDSRRIIVSAWNVAKIQDMKLPPCHAFFQFYTAPLSHEERYVELNKMVAAKKIHMEDIPEVVEFFNPHSNDERLTACVQAFDELGVPKYRLSCQLYQRSADSFLGVPFNIASYALLTMMVTQVTNMVPGEFVWTGGDCHLYQNHLEQVDLQLSRDPLPLPTMKINPEVKDIFGFKYEDFELVGYESHPAIKAPVAV